MVSVRLRAVMRLCSHTIRCLAVACAGAVLAAEGPPKPLTATIIELKQPDSRNSAPTTFLLKTDADLDALMAQAKQFVATGQHGPAIEIYQGVIEKAEDRVVAAPVEGGADETARLFLPAADAARRALLDGPKAMRMAYAARFEAETTKQVDAAAAGGDVAALRRIASRFPATAAAQRARWRCATWLADTGDFAAAAAAWEEFLALQPTLGAADEDMAMTLAQQTLALARSGQVGRARQTLARLEKDFATTKRVIGGTELGVVDFVRRALAVAKTRTAAVALPEAFAPTPQWATQTKEELAPFVCANSGRIFTRTLKSIACLEMASGKRLWELPAMMQNTAESAALRMQIPGASSDREVVGQQRYAVSATPEMVCYVENSPPGGANFEMPAMVMGRGPGPIMPQINKFAGSSRLTARDALSGRLRWCIGRGEGRDEFSRDARWVSSPVIAGNQVFVIALHIQSFHLVCLDAADGRLVWRSLISHRAEGGMNFQGLRDLSSASAPCVADGCVLCLTNGGVFAGFDQLTGEPRWFCQYTPLVVSGVNMVPPTRLAPVNPVLAREQFAVILPADADQVMAFDIGTGRMLWRQPRKERRFLAGIATGKNEGELMLLTGATAAALSLDTGKQVWEKALDANAGRSVLRGGTLYWPSRYRGVVQLDVSSGRELRCSASASAEFRHLAEADTALMAVGRHSLTVLRSLGDALDEMTRRVESTPAEEGAWRQRGELNLQAARFAEAFEDLTKALALQRKTRTSHAQTEALLFRCCLEMTARDSAKSSAWLERAAEFATTAAMRSERWLRVADAHETRKSWPAAADALQQILDHETEAWLDQPESDGGSGARLAGGRVSNRSVAAQRLEQLAEAHGVGVSSHAEATARRQLADAVQHRDTGALMEITAQHPVGETQERAWLMLAAWRFEARQWDAAADVLQQFLLAEPHAVHGGDAALGVALAGIQSARGGLARKGLALLETLPPKTRVSFGSVVGSAADVRQSLSREMPLPSPPREVEPGNQAVREPGREISLLPGADNLAGGRLFVDGRQFVRVGPDGARVVWTSAPVVEKRGETASAGAVVLTDSVIVFCGTQMVALDADTGKLLWVERGVMMGNLSAAVPAVVFGPAQVVIQGGGIMQMMANGRPMTSGLRTLFVAGQQLLRMDAAGRVASFSPRSGKAGWSVRLPEPAGVWAIAAMRTSGRYVALAAAAGEQTPEIVPAAAGLGKFVFKQTGDSAGEIRVAMLDVWRGRLLAVWNVPKDWPEFSIRPDGRVQWAENRESKSDNRQ